MTRVPWPNDFPDVFVNAMWASKEKDVASLKSHPLYQPAKGERDMRSALSLIDDIITKETVENLASLATRSKVAPKLIAPAAQLGDSNNALATGYAYWLGKELDWEVEERVFQAKAFSKDKSNAWTRIANTSAFYGEIDKTTPYVIVDDVITLGGTLADLRSFILGKGGSVIGMSALASRNGHDTPIHLGQKLKSELEKFYGSNFASDCQSILGYSHDCLTRSEGEKVLGCSGYVDLRKKVNGGRN